MEGCGIAGRKRHQMCRWSTDMAKRASRDGSKVTRQPKARSRAICQLRRPRLQILSHGGGAGTQM